MLASNVSSVTMPRVTFQSGGVFRSRAVARSSRRKTTVVISEPGDSASFLSLNYDMPQVSEAAKVGEKCSSDVPPAGQ